MAGQGGGGMQGRGRERIESRQAQIASFVGLKGYTRFSELADLTGVSELTIRRDLKILQERCLLNLVPGGATADSVGASMIQFKKEVSRHQAEKQAIGKAATALVQDGETVLLDGGTTTWYVAEALRGRNLEVVTNSLPVADLLGHEKGIRVIVLGGVLYSDTGVTLGSLCERQLRALHPSVLFMGAGGVTTEGFTNSNVQLVDTERVMMEVSGRRVVVADSSKFGRRDLARLSAIGAIDVIVTDDRITPEQRSLVARRNLDLVVAPVERRNGTGNGNGNGNGGGRDRAH
jgi:DeoR/GlpR family transcriptional regulator of sugar metabolism